MRRELNWLCVVLFCTDAHALQAPALRRSTVVTTSHRSGLAGPVAVRTPHAVMVSPGWRIAAVTTGASSVVSTVVAVREWRGRRRAMRQVGDLNATVLSLKSDLKLAAKRQKSTQASLTRAREKGEAARVYGMQMADALEREQTARRAELVFKAKEARELAAANYERQRELQAEIVREREAKEAAAAEGASLSATVAELEQTLALERTRLQGEARALFDRLQAAEAAAQEEKARLEADKAGLRREAEELSSQYGALEASGAALRTELEARIANLDGEIAQLTISSEVLGLGLGLGLEGRRPRPPLQHLLPPGERRRRATGAGGRGGGQGGLRRARTAARATRGGECRGARAGARREHGGGAGGGGRAGGDAGGRRRAGRRGV